MSRALGAANSSTPIAPGVTVHPVQNNPTGLSRDPLYSRRSGPPQAPDRVIAATLSAYSGKAPRMNQNRRRIPQGHNARRATLTRCTSIHRPHSRPCTRPCQVPGEAGLGTQRSLRRWRCSGDPFPGLLRSVLESCIEVAFGVGMTLSEISIAAQDGHWERKADSARWDSCVAGNGSSGRTSGTHASVWRFASR